MTEQTLRYPTLLEWLLPVHDNTKTRSVVLAVIGTVILTISAKFQIPFFPVPMTMQTLVVLMIGMGFGPRLGAATLVLYLAEGAIGLPVFAGTPEKGLGLAYMLGGTGGYLLGFVMAAGACGWLAHRGWDRSILKTAAALVIGNAIIYVPGLLWLGIIYGFDKPLLTWGLYPFIPGDLTKLALAAAILPGAWLLAKKIKGQN